MLSYLIHSSETLVIQKIPRTQFCGSFENHTVPNVPHQPHQWHRLQHQKMHPTILLFHITQGPLLHKARACWTLAARDAVQPLLQVRRDITNVVLLPLPKSGIFGLEIWGGSEKNQKLKACQKLLLERQWCSLWSVPRSPGKAGRATQWRHDQLLCSKPALVGAPGWCTDNTSKIKAMAMQIHQLEHPLPLHSTTFSCFHNLPAKP